MSRLFGGCLNRDRSQLERSVGRCCPRVLSRSRWVLVRSLVNSNLVNVRLRKLSSLLYHFLGGLELIGVIYRFFVVKFEGRAAVFFIIIILTAIITVASFIKVNNLTHAPCGEPILKIMVGVRLFSHHAICQSFICS